MLNLINSMFNTMGVLNKDYIVLEILIEVYIYKSEIHNKNIISELKPVILINDWRGNKRK